MRTYTSVVSLMFTLLCWAIPASAQTVSTPQVPAQEMLGATPMAVLRPSETRGLQFQLPLAMDRTQLSYAFGLSAAPMRTYLWERGWNNATEIERWMSGFDLSLAVGHVASFGDALPGNYEMASTLSFQLWNDRDVLRNRLLSKCLDRDAGLLANDLPATGPKRRRALSRERINNCLGPWAHALAIGAGAADDFGQIWINYELAYGPHAFTVEAEKIVAHKDGANVASGGLRYTLDTYPISPMIDGRIEVLPVSSEVFANTRISSGIGVNIATPWLGISILLGARITTPYSSHNAEDSIVRGFFSLGWGGYSLPDEYFARSAAQAR